MTATVYFADGSTLALRSGDRLIPIVLCPATETESSFSSMSDSVVLCPNVHNGLIPAILDVILSCQFFYIGDDCDTAYCTSSIVKIENA